MINRRDFLRNLGATLGIAAAAQAAAPYIFDMGANLYKREPFGTVGHIGGGIQVNYIYPYEKYSPNYVEPLLRPVKIDGEEYYTLIVPPNIVAEIDFDTAGSDIDRLRKFYQGLKW